MLHELHDHEDVIHLPAHHYLHVEAHLLLQEKPNGTNGTNGTHPMRMNSGQRTVSFGSGAQPMVLKRNLWQRAISCGAQVYSVAVTHNPLQWKVTTHGSSRCLRMLGHRLQLESVLDKEQHVNRVTVSCAAQAPAIAQVEAAASS